jgi:hypothetical protein
MSWLGKLQTAHTEATARPTDGWSAQLERIRGTIGDDDIERVTTQMLLDVLQVPQRRRRPGTYRRLAKVMAELGWTPVRVRGLTRGAYLEQVRGYARGARTSRSI